jgi:hypothetical protein
MYLPNIRAPAGIVGGAVVGVIDGVTVATSTGKTASIIGVVLL